LQSCSVPRASFALRAVHQCKRALGPHSRWRKKGDRAQSLGSSTFPKSETRFQAGKLPPLLIELAEHLWRWHGVRAEPRPGLLPSSGRSHHHPCQEGRHGGLRTPPHSQPGLQRRHLPSCQVREARELARESTSHFKGEFLCVGIRRTGRIQRR
jgi:hypothetical protein